MTRLLASRLLIGNSTKVVLYTYLRVNSVLLPYTSIVVRLRSSALRLACLALPVCWWSDVVSGPRRPLPLIAHTFALPCLQAILTDMYQVTMSYAYWRAGRHNEHVSPQLHLFIPQFYSFEVQQCITAVQVVLLYSSHKSCFPKSPAWPWSGPVRCKKKKGPVLLFVGLVRFGMFFAGPVRSVWSCTFFCQSGIGPVRSFFLLARPNPLLFPVATWAQAR